MLLIIALFAISGSVARNRTQSVLLGVLAGVWCALVALVILLSFAFSNLLFATRAESHLQFAFVAGMTKQKRWLFPVLAILS